MIKTRNVWYTDANLNAGLKCSMTSRNTHGLENCCSKLDRVSLSSKSNCASMSEPFFIEVGKRVLELNGDVLYTLWDSCDEEDLADLLIMRAAAKLNKEK